MNQQHLSIRFKSGETLAYDGDKWEARFLEKFISMYNESDRTVIMHNTDEISKIDMRGPKEKDKGSKIIKPVWSPNI